MPTSGCCSPAGHHFLKGGPLLSSLRRFWSKTMRCVCCGYVPTPSERAEQPYGCPKCEPEAYIPPLESQLKSCAGRVLDSLRKQLVQATLRAK
jgi:hypothetical protein